MKVIVEKQKNVKISNEEFKRFTIDAKIAWDEELRIFDEETDAGIRSEEPKQKIVILSLCENIVEDATISIPDDHAEYVSLPINADGEDGGYLHVYGWREK